MKQHDFSSNPTTNERENLLGFGDWLQIYFRRKVKGFLRKIAPFSNVKRPEMRGEPDWLFFFN